MLKQMVPSVSTPSTERDWLTPKEICVLRQIPEQTFYQWRAKGVRPHAYRIGRHLRVTRSDLDARLLLRSDP